MRSNTVYTERLEFRGVVADGAGLFSQQIKIPGSCELTESISGWPLIIYPGTLNVRIDLDGFPAVFAKRFHSNSLKHLDSRDFTPITEIAAHLIGNNTLPPTKAMPDRGNAQVWNAKLSNLKTANKAQCWVLRRIGSNLASVLECVAGESLRSVLNLQTGDPVKLTLLGSWIEK